MAHQRKVLSAGQVSRAKAWHAPQVTCDSEARRSDDTDIVEVQNVSPPTVEQIEEIRSAAEKEGYEQGLQNAQAEAEVRLSEESQKLAVRWNELLNGLSEPYVELDDLVEKELISMVLAIAKQLVRRELKTAPGELVPVVREALAALPSAARKIRIHLHPSDCGMVEESLGADVQRGDWSIVEDPSLAVGDCRVFSKTSAIDARLETRIESVIATIVGSDRNG